MSATPSPCTFRAHAEATARFLGWSVESVTRCRRPRTTAIVWMRTPQGDRIRSTYLLDPTTHLVTSTTTYGA